MAAEHTVSSLPMAATASDLQIRPEVRHRVAANLVAVEGIDKAGKTTLVTALEAELRRRGMRVARHKEPSDGHLGASFRRLSTVTTVNPLAMALMSAADRADQQRHLADLCQTHDVVLADRYYLSGLAYHAADGIDLTFYQYLNTMMIRPGLYLFLQVNPGVAAARYSDGERPDRWERDTVASRLPDSYETALARITDDEHANIVRLDANPSAAVVLSDALAVVAHRLPTTVSTEAAP
ncbi:dTMP kinase [Frankia sp. Cj5]|uniref:dTMP kinase n=1 Tax=Frankia sp. Cj5 TaxID=2880978 RepID=UPI001EF43038|nr:dTMP kinase [Frankia sp. Cj5]